MAVGPRSVVLLVATISYFFFPQQVESFVVQQKIVNGRLARPGEIPYQQSLQTANGDHFCGASLVSQDGIQFAVSAAHCFRRYYYPTLILVAGKLALNDTSTGQSRIVEHVEIHPKYKTDPSSPHHNDIALLFFKEPFTLNSNVDTISLPTKSMKDMQGEVTVTGWGSMDYGLPASNDLQLVEVDVVEDTDCQEIWNQGGMNTVVDSMLCTKSPGGDQGPCKGDSGGPARMFIGERSVLVGIVSFAHITSQFGCVHPEFPAVFTEVAYFRKWINKQIKEYKNQENNIGNK